MLLVDSRSSLKHLSQTGELYAEQENVDEELPNNLWDATASSLEVIREKRVEKPKFQQDLNAASGSSVVSRRPEDYNLSETVNTWTDYLYSRYHPRSINVIKDQAGQCDETTINDESFDCYTAGGDLWKSEYFQDTFSDRIRQYIEECNNCQVSYDARKLLRKINKIFMKRNNLKKKIVQIGFPNNI